MTQFAERLRTLLLPPVVASCTRYCNNRLMSTLCLIIISLYFNDAFQMGRRLCCGVKVCCSDRNATSDFSHLANSLSAAFSLAGHILFLGPIRFPCFPDKEVAATRA